MTTRPQIIVKFYSRERGRETPTLPFPLFLCVCVCVTRDETESMSKQIVLSPSPLSFSPSLKPPEVVFYKGKLAGGTTVMALFH